MDKVQTRNDSTAAVPKFCLTLEQHRRTAEGRVRSTQEFLSAFFPHDASGSNDRVFRYMPNDVRGPILAAWGIRGAKAALRDSDEKVQSVVFDALVAGDINHSVFEEGIGADTLLRWVPLADFWTFWRGGKLSKGAIQKALSSAYELSLFDAKWFFDTVEGRGGKLRGTDVVADGLTKDDLTEWVRKIHESGDGSPKGLLAAIGWDKTVAKTSNDVLIAVIDAMVQKVGLVKPPEPKADKPGEKSGPSLASLAGSSSLTTSAAPPAPAPEKPAEKHAEAKAAAPPTASATPSKAPGKPGDAPHDDFEWSEPDGGKAAEHSVENEPTISQKGDAGSDQPGAHARGGGSRGPQRGRDDCRGRRRRDERGSDQPQRPTDLAAHRGGQAIQPRPFPAGGLAARHEERSAASRGRGEARREEVRAPAPAAAGQAGPRESAALTPGGAGHS